MKKYIYLLFGVTALLGSCAQDECLDTPPESKTANTSEISLLTQGMPGIVHVKVQSNVLDEITRINSGGVSLQSAPSLLANTLHSIQATELRPLFRIDPRFEGRMRREGLDRWYEVRFNEKQNLQQTLNTLTQSRQFSIVEPVFASTLPVVKTGTTFSTDVPAATTEVEMPFDDPLLNKQWHYKNFGTTSKSVAGADANVFEAWETETGKPNVIVAVVDGGIDVTHEDLVDNLWINEGEIPGNGIDDDGNGYIDDVYGWNFFNDNGEITLDDVGHGTHVAGTVAARNNNGIGVGGIAGGDGSPGSGARLMSCQKFHDRYGVTAEEAFVYSANNGAVISQNSWGYEYPGPGYLPGSIKEAIDYFIKYAGCDDEGNQLPNSPMKGGVVIFAAGNDGKDYVSYPGAYEPVIAVSAMAPDWKASYYTNRGDWVDIMAPGGDAYYSNGQVYSTVPASIYNGKQYEFMQGTSMACPHVSGIAALVVSHFGGQGFTNEDLKARLLGSLRPENIDVRNPEYVGRLGIGYIDAALTFATNQNKKPNDITDLSAETNYTDITLSWSAVADEDDGSPAKYLIYFSDKEMTETNYKNLTPVTLSAMGIQPGEKMAYSFKGLKENTVYNVAVIAVDRWGLESGFKVSSFTTLKNDPPVIEGIPETPIRISGTDTEQFSVQISDPNGHKITHQLGGEQRGVSVVRDENTLNFTLRAVAPISDTPYEIELTVTDELGASTTGKILFEVFRYQAPGIIQSFQDIIMDPDNTTQAFSLDQYFSGTELSFSVESSDESVAAAAVDGNNLSVTGKKQGEATITVTATNGKESLQSSFRVRFVGNKNDLVYQIYPIPASTHLNILLNPTISKADVSIRSLMGEEVFSNLYTVVKLKPININLQQFAAGTYTLVVETSKGTYKKTFVKQ